MAWIGRDVWVAAIIVMVVAAAGGLLSEIGPWYLALNKPAWQPPDWLFGPAWTTIFTLTAMAGVLTWRGAAGSGERGLVLGVFLLNGALNIGWSLLFFHLRRPDWALFEVVALWLSVALTMWVSRRHAKIAPWFLLPYLLWVSFAGALNLAITRLNGPFG